MEKLTKIEGLTQQEEPGETLAVLKAQMEMMERQLHAIQAQLANPSMVDRPRPTKLRTSEPVPSCVEGGQRHTVTRSQQVRENVDGEIHVLLKRRCDGCLKSWVVKDYGVQ